MICPVAFHGLRDVQLGQNVPDLQSLFGSVDVVVHHPGFLHTSDIDFFFFFYCLEKLPDRRKHKKTYLAPIVFVSGM